jgi:hypothetical protein
MGWRSSLTVVGLVAVLAVCGTASDFEVSDLLLASWAGVDGGTSAYTSQVCGAMIEYWFGARGYTEFWKDLSGDGTVDERDVARRAKDRAEEIAAYYHDYDPDVGTQDCWEIGEYVYSFGTRYPDQFKFKIYDDTIRSENLQVKGRSLDVQAYADAGVTVEVYGNATRDNYVNDLQQGAAILVGVGQEGSYKTYFVAYGYGEHAQGTQWPVALADTAPDPFQSDLQGQVLDTFLREGDPWWYAQYGAWQPIEFMLSILPVSAPPYGTGSPAPGTTGRPPSDEGQPQPPGDCSGDCYTSNVTTAEGDFVVEECEQRNVGGVDIYTYEVRNISHKGLCSFVIPTSGLVASNLWETSGCWVATSGSSYWTWNYDETICAPGGLAPGASNTFGVEVPSPTVDVLVDGDASACATPSPGGATAVEIPDVSGDWVICSGGNCGAIFIQQNGLDFYGSSTSIPGIQEYTIDGTISLNRTLPAPGAGYSGWDYPASVTVTTERPRISLGVRLDEWHTSSPSQTGPVVETKTVQGHIAAQHVLNGDGECRMWGWWIPLAALGEFTRAEVRERCPAVVEFLPFYKFPTCCPEGEDLPTPPDPGEGESTTGCSVSPTSIRFWTVTVGDQSSWKTFTIENTGTTDIAGSISLTGADASEFEFKPFCGSYQLGTMPGEKETCQVRFVPTSTGSKEAYVHIGPPGGPCPDIRLWGTGEEEVVPTCPDLVITSLSACYNFGSPHTLTITGTVKNQGTATATNCGVGFWIGDNCSIFPMYAEAPSLGTMTENESKYFQMDVSVSDPGDCAPFGVDATTSCSETECDESNNSRWTQADGPCAEP